MKEVKSTKNYKQFKKLIGNRKVDEKRIDKIIKSIQKVGYITSPIIVNEKLEVIDGQGRLEALERLHMPIEYIVEEGIGIDECISMNVYQTNWTILDYIISYASRGNENYIRLLKLHQEYPIFSIHALATALYGVGKLTPSIVNRGDLILTEERYESAKRTLDYAMRFVPYMDNFYQSKNCFLQGIMYSSMIDGVDKEKLLQKFIGDGRIMRPYHTLCECMQSIEEMYNRGLHNYVYIFTQYRILSKENLKRGSSMYSDEIETNKILNNSTIEINSAEELKEALNKEE